MLTTKQKSDLKNFYAWKLKPEKVRSLTGISLSEIEQYYQELNQIQSNNRLALELTQAHEQIHQLQLQVESLEALKREREKNK